MKKLVFFLVIGMLLLSVAAFAQTTQGVNSQGNQNAQGVNLEDFARGGYTGPVLAPIAIKDLVSTAPNEFVIVEGYVVQQRVPSVFILGDTPSDYTVSVVVRFNDYGWVNLNIEGSTPVRVYGIVNRSEMRIEVEATRIEIIQ